MKIKVLFEPAIEEEYSFKHVKFNPGVYVPKTNKNITFAGIVISLSDGTLLYAKSSTIEKLIEPDWYNISFVKAQSPVTLNICND